MAQPPTPVTFRELIAHRPLVLAWIWEVVCVLAAGAVVLTTENFPLVMALILAGIVPFSVVLLLFIQARKAGTQGPRRGNIVE